jgi:carboxypeptidase family protein
VTEFLRLGPIRQQVSIGGRVTDAQTGRALGGAQVEITAAPADFSSWLRIRARQHGEHWDAMASRPDRTRAGLDGHFHFCDLPRGQYTLTASLPGGGTRYGTSEVAVTVSSPDVPAALAVADLALSPTRLEGRVTAAAGQSPLLLAEVRVDGSGEQTFTDAGGNYHLVALEVGTRTVVVSAQGYASRTATVQLQPAGTVQRIDVALDR